MIYAAKKDRWVIGVVVSVSLALVALAVAWPILFGALGLCFLPAGLLGLVLVVWVVGGISYEITATELVVRAWPFCARIPLASIEEVQSLRKFMIVDAWKLALSLDRILVRYRGSWFGVGALISPRDKESFVRQLVEKVPHLRVTGDCAAVSQA
jgi:hypothetical protein